MGIDMTNELTKWNWVMSANDKTLAMMLNPLSELLVCRQWYNKIRIRLGQLESCTLWWKKLTRKVEFMVVTLVCFGFHSYPL